MCSFRRVHKSWVRQRPLSPPMQLSLPPQPVASIGFVDGLDDVGHGDVLSATTQRIPAARTARGLHELGPAQLAEQLLQVRERDLLALADGGERNRPLVLAQGEVQHGGNGKTAFGGQSHESGSGFRGAGDATRIPEQARSNCGFTR